MPLPTPCTPTMPVVMLAASLRSVRPWSSICWRVITLIDCGISFRAWVPLPMVTARAA